MQPKMRWVTVALVLLSPAIALSGELAQGGVASGQSQGLGKAANRAWEVTVLSATSESGKVSVYIDSGSTADVARRTIKSTDLIGGILGTMQAPEDRYVLVAKVTIKNLQNEKAQFYLDDLSLESDNDSAKPGAYATGDESATPANVPVSTIGEPSTFSFPLMTKHNVEFGIPPGHGKEFRFLFSVPRKAPDLLLQFRDLKAIKISRPALPAHEKKEK